MIIFLGNNNNNPKITSGNFKDQKCYQGCTLEMSFNSILNRFPCVTIENIFIFKSFYLIRFLIIRKSKNIILSYSYIY